MYSTDGSPRLPATQNGKPALQLFHRVTPNDVAMPSDGYAEASVENESITGGVGVAADHAAAQTQGVKKRRVNSISKLAIHKQR